jgi:hypothetical protein
VCAVRIGGKLYCKEDADRVFGSRAPNLGEEIVEVGGSKAGMVLALLGGCVYLFLGVLAAYAFLVGESSLSASLSYESSSDAQAALHGIAYMILGILVTAIGVVVGGMYLSSSDRTHRRQGGMISIIAGIIGLLVVLALPFAIIPGGSPGYFYATAAGASIVFFAVEFGGFILVLIGGALGITRK